MKDQVLCLLCICSKACLWYNLFCNGHVSQTRVYLQLLISSPFFGQKEPQLISLLTSSPTKAELVVVYFLPRRGKADFVVNLSPNKEPELKLACVALSSQAATRLTQTLQNLFYITLTSTNSGQE